MFNSKRIIRVLGTILSISFLISYSERALAYNGLFGSFEYKSTELSAFKKWTDLIERQQFNSAMANKKSGFKEIRKYCQLSKNFKCKSDEWRDLISALKHESADIKMTSINDHLNQIEYIPDSTNWKQKDYWATLNQFIDKAGDCEDFAIAKYFSLKELGFNGDQMRIVIVHDTKLDLDHAVLAVYLEGDVWILDNQISQIKPAQNIAHYKPLYSINENAWWLHKK